MIRRQVSTFDIRAPVPAPIYYWQDGSWSATEIGRSRACTNEPLVARTRSALPLRKHAGSFLAKGLPTCVSCLPLSFAQRRVASIPKPDVTSRSLLPPFVPHGRNGNTGSIINQVFIRFIIFGFPRMSLFRNGG